ncbi:MAG: amino acid ABC transporter substrate-binding protein [Eubacteriales bacterium]
MKRILSLLLCALMLGTALIGCAEKKEGTFILGLDDSFPPMGFQDENGNIVGFDIDLATEVCKRLGYELKLQPIKWDLKQQELDSGNIDCIWNGFTINDERLAACAMTAPYLKNRQVLVVKTDSAIASLEDMAGKKLALQSGSSANDALDASADFKASLGEALLYDDNTKALLDLESGGCDAVLMDEVVAKYYATSHTAVKSLDVSLADEEYGIGFRKADTELCKKVEDTLKAMAKDGNLAEISTKWFGSDITIIK